MAALFGLVALVLTVIEVCLAARAVAIVGLVLAVAALLASVLATMSTAIGSAHSPVPLYSQTVATGYAADPYDAVPYTYPSTYADPAPTTQTPAPPPVPAWGTTATLTPGVTATTSRPRKYPMSSNVYGADGAKRLVRVDVTIRNNSGRIVNFSEAFQFSQTIDGASTPGASSYEGLNGPTFQYPPNRAVGNDQQVTFVVLWAVPTDDPAVVGLSVSNRSDFNDAAAWAGSA